MTNRKYLPNQYIDEICPLPRTSPDAWIIWRDGQPYLDGDELGGIEATRLEEGEIVKFDYLITLGQFNLTRTANSEDIFEWGIDGDEPTAPEGTHLSVWFPGDYDSISPDIQTLTDSLDPDYEGETVDYYAWSAEPACFEFRTGTFHEVGKT